MMVTFVSQCEKKALNRTRRVLDAFADRIGDNTWQTVITQEGLLAVKKLLRKTASKNTAVSCHWIRSRSRSELVWVVGSKDKFDQQGRVPVNLTESSVEQYIDKGAWSSLSVICHAATIAALFHDFGKANCLFQDKINPELNTDKFEPYRHEWVSLRLFEAFVADRNDAEWLHALAELDELPLNECYKDGLENKGKAATKPLVTLPPFAKLVAWLILSHHRLPSVARKQDGPQRRPSLSNIDQWIDKEFEPSWNSSRCEDPGQLTRLQDNWRFRALPYQSSKWRNHASSIASDALAALPSIGRTDSDFLHQQLFTTHITRLVLMLADHCYSSKDEITPQWRANGYKMYANTYRNNSDKKGYKQQLDEHLIGVAYCSQGIAKALPKLKSSLQQLGKNTFLDAAVPKEPKDDEDDFGWQDVAKKFAKNIAEKTRKQGFFGINMASTGKGKTLANAKIMATIGEQTDGVRLSVAIGLRTLTLQTGREYRNRLELNEEQLAIAVGGAAVKQLFEYAEKSSKNDEREIVTGSDSQQSLLDSELYVDYQGDTSHALSQWTEHDEHIDKLLSAPVLVSTIDHLIPATDGTRGGKQIAPMLRLLTSDLVLDEPDDFGLDDLPGLCRLVHWAGVMGSRVLLSTATLPPALAYAAYEAYQNGWAEYAKVNVDSWNGSICCAWFDEFGTSREVDRDISDLSAFKLSHKRFIDKRLNKLAKSPQRKRLGEIAVIDSTEKTFSYLPIAETIHSQIINLHRHHHCTKGDRSVSIGLVRMANINPLVEVTQALISTDAPDKYCIHYCVYHGRYPLAIRAYIERELDGILNRKDEDAVWNEASPVGRVLNKHPEKHHIFVVLASPVAEVGRDHDYDWAIVEPSSLRSIIQLAGRLLRHRNKQPTKPNLILLNRNIKALKGKEICFEKPGFESEGCKVESKDLRECLPSEHFEFVSAMPRIVLPNQAESKPTVSGDYKTLNSTEHKALALRLFSGTEPAKAWWQQQPHWCAEMQRQQPFRRSQKDDAYYLWLENNYDQPKWKWLNEDAYPPKLGELAKIAIHKMSLELPLGRGVHWWFDLSPQAIYSQLTEDLGLELPDVSRRFGELRVTTYDKSQSDEYWYHNNLGLFQKES